MKQSQILYSVATFAFAGTALSITDASAGHRRRPAQSIAAIAVGNPNLSILVEAVVRTGLVETLDEDGPFTVFAPTNQAFENLLATRGASSLDDIDDHELKMVLLDHVVEGRFRRRRLTFFDRTDRELSTLGGLALDFDRKPFEVNDIRVVTADIRAKNGIVHVIDAVLLDPDPRPTITDLARSNPDLSILVEAAVRTGFDRILANGKPFTVFAPTNQAFMKLLDALGLSSLDDVDDRTLTNILLDHVVAQELDGIDVVKRARRHWFFGGIRTTGNLVLAFDEDPLTVNGLDIVATDVEAENGTVHVIDGVLLDR